MNYQRKRLPDLDIGQPAPLPSELVGLDDATLADLSAALDPTACDELGYTGQGFFPVEDPPPPPVAPIISPYDLLMLFTTPERIAIRTAAQNSMAIADWLGLLDHVQAVHMDDPKTIGGVQALEQAGLIALGRAAVILANKAPT